MKTIKYTEAKTLVARQAITLIDMFNNGAPLSIIKQSANNYGLELKGRSFKAIKPQLVNFYDNAMIVEESETLTIKAA